MKKNLLKMQEPERTILIFQYFFRFKRRRDDDDDDDDDDELFLWYG